MGSPEFPWKGRTALEKRKQWLWALPALLVTALLVTACGDTKVVSGDGQANTLNITGEGRVRAEPDIAQFSVGVSVLRDTVARAQADASGAMTAVLTSLKGNGVAEADIRTDYFSVYPEYAYKPEGDQELRGFRVNNSVTAIVRDLDTLSTVVDDAIGAGGNDITVNGITFSIEDTDALQDQARELATADARAKAERLAELTGVDLGAVITVSEGGGAPTPYFDQFGRGGGAQAAAVPTPIGGGQIEIVMNVFVTYSLK